MWVGTFVASFSIALAAILSWAGLTKIVQPEPAEAAISTVLRDRLRRAADSLPQRGRVLGVYEILLGGALLVPSFRVLAMLASCVTFATFSVFSFRAKRLGTPCGCSASSATTTAVTGTVIRAAVIAVLSLVSLGWVQMASEQSTGAVGRQLILALLVVATFTLFNPVGLIRTVLTDLRRTHRAYVTSLDERETPNAGVLSRRRLLIGLATAGLVLAAVPKTISTSLQLISASRHREPGMAGERPRVTETAIVDPVLLAELHALLLSSAPFLRYVATRGLVLDESRVVAVESHLTWMAQSLIVRQFQVGFVGGGVVLMASELGKPAYGIVVLPAGLADPGGQFYWNGDTSGFQPFLDTSCLVCTLAAVGLIGGGVLGALSCATCVISPNPLSCAGCIEGPGNAILGGALYPTSCGTACLGGCAAFAACVASSELPALMSTHCVCQQVGQAASGCGCSGSNSGATCWRCTTVTGAYCGCLCCCPASLGCTAAGQEGAQIQIQAQTIVDTIGRDYPNWLGQSV